MPANTAVNTKVKEYLKRLGEEEVGREYDYLKAIQLSPTIDAYHNPYFTDF
jgi:hypothetical protein